MLEVALSAEESEEALFLRGTPADEGLLLLLDALALFRDGQAEAGMRCIRKLQRSQRLHALVDLLSPGFALRHDRRAQRIRRNILGVYSDGGAGNDPVPVIESAPTQPGLESALTPRQRALLVLLRDGLTNRQIADRMLISENTVKWHLKTLSRRLGAGNRCSLLCIAERKKLMPARPV